ncbi:MAG: flagellar motor switch protein FliG [Nitrospinae bacterium]|jgi:flagellar motor switch protein FliG|nr:flagellar motor switch protein FliG [Nitrospinota bacterium]MDA1109528.1 flagellar motor switch protein FliG [Nitrospinota bacterium]
MARQFTGPEKAAILLMSLGEENAVPILENMDEREIQMIGNYISSLGDVDMPSMDAVTKEFYDSVDAGTGGLGIARMDFLKSALMKALDPAKAMEILNNITTPGDEMGGGLETVRMLEPRTIAAFLVNEHPQTAAIIIAHLDTPMASQTIRELPEENRMEIVHRLASLERVSPSILRELDEALQNEFRASGAVSGSKLGGLESAAHIMGALDRATETSILSAMDEVDPDMANEIRNLRFTYEDILKIDDQGIQLILKEVNNEDLLISLKTASDALKDKWLNNMSERAALMIREDLESMGPTKISEVEKTQSKIVGVCKKLEEEGKISVGGGSGEELV